MEGLEIWLDDYALGRATRALRRQIRDIPKEVQKAIVKEGHNRVRLAKAKVISMPVKGTNRKGRRGLRKDVARGVELTEVSGGVHISTSMPKANEAVIPRGMDTRKGWKHPVFGQAKTPWARSLEDYSWFTETFSDARLPLTKDIHDILEDAADKIDKEIG